jgi:hypothetical protein
MSQSKIKSSRSYTRHSADYKKEALRLAEVHGVSKAASDLKLSESQIYAWRVQGFLISTTRYCHVVKVPSPVRRGLG